MAAPRRSLYSSQSQPPAAAIRDPSTPSSWSPRLAATASSTFADSSSTAQQRLSVISRHFASTPSLELNTPYSTERHSSSQPTMSSQPEHPTVLIPGPIEYSDEVLQSMSHFSQSHVGPAFVKTFSETLKMLRDVFQTKNPKSQPFVISGSGTLGWDQVAANLTEPGDEALVLHSGYFADSFADCFETYGVKATQIKAPVGQRPQLPEIEAALKEKKYKVLTVTHVDTSTGVLSEVTKLTQLVRRVSPETLVIVDGVCSVGAEDIRFDEMDLDVVMTASQKALGCPAGLSVLMASERAINVYNSRKVRPTSYFASWKNWIPIMQSYEANKPAYFATPSPQLIHALHTALTQLLAQGVDKRVQRHKEVSQKVKKTIAELGLKQLAENPDDQASTMTAIWLPEGISAPEFLPGLMSRGIVFAGGLHKECAAKYIRFGHMGISVMDPSRSDIDKALNALKERVVELQQAKGN